MIATHDRELEQTDLWSRLAAKLPDGAVSWRQDGKPTLRDGKHFARFVAYIEAGTVRERLDLVVPGEWDLTLEMLPLRTADSDGAIDEASVCSFKARLQILGVIREDVGCGKDYKQASTDAFKRAAVRFGIGHELYEYEQNWVQVDGDSRYAKPLEDPQTAYTRRYGRAPGVTEAAASANANGVTAAPSGNGVSAPTTASTAPRASTTPNAAPSATSGELEPACPKCSNRMWDNRATKRNPKAPDFKCRDRSCDGVIWPPKPAGAFASSGKSRQAQSKEARSMGADLPDEFGDADLDASPLSAGTDDIPF
jgi:hypothetical protein